MSDEEDFDSDDGDFSASEDEWVPGKNERESSSDADSDELLNEEPKPVAKRKTERKAKTPKRPAIKKSQKKSLRDELYRKYKNAEASLFYKPKSTKTMSNANATTELVKNSDRSKVESDSTDSESSGDDHLIDPKNLDLNSRFFTSVPMTSAAASTPPPQFDCNIGIRLSDNESESASDNDSFEDVPSTSKRQPNKTTKANSSIDLSKQANFTQNIEAAKVQLSKFQSKPQTDSPIDVKKLLAIGESSQANSVDRQQQQSKLKKITKKQTLAVDSDSDWEDVQEHYSATTDGVQITVAPDVVMKKKTSKEDEFEAALKRQLNRVMREKQLAMHKVHILLLIAHGNYVNRILNNSQLMKLCIKLIPSSQCYPKGRTDIKYFEQITKWFKTQIALNGNEMYAKLSKLPPLLVSLALQIRSKAVICKKDFVLIFVILLRAMGIQCRLIINLATVPLKPLTLKTTSTTKTTSVTKTSVKSKIKKNLDKTPPSTSKGVQKNSKNNDNKSSIITVNSPSFSGNKVNILTSPISKRTRHKLANRSDKPKGSETKPPKFTQLDGADDLPPNKCKPNLANLKKVKAIPVTTGNKRSAPSSSKVSTMDSVNNSAAIPPKCIAIKSKKPNLEKLKNPKTMIEAKISKKPVKSKSSKKRPSDQSNDNADLDYSPTLAKKRPNVNKQKTSTNSSPQKTPIKHAHIDRRVISTDEEETKGDSKTDTKNRMDYWVEVFCEEEAKWISIDLFKSKVHCVEEVRKNATKPIAYVLAWNNDNGIKDVSARYCLQWHTTTRKLRVEQDWLEKVLRRYKKKRNPKDEAEELELNKILLKEPLPTSISEYKNHPLYVLERHLLKFESIYPPNPLIIGYIRNEPVYSRDCVHTLHSREIWVKQARVVKPNEEPYKIVKARPKWDRITNSMSAPQPLEIFGYWQTKPYEPPTAENGIVPRNAYGNVELFKPEMLPNGTVHLQLPGLNRTCKKLGIDCAQAVVGFDFHSGSSHPTFDGFVICKEFGEKVVEQWWADQEEAERKEVEKYEQRVFGNWKKLIRGLILRERLQKKYKFKKNENEDQVSDSGIIDETVKKNEKCSADEINAKQLETLAATGNGKRAAAGGRKVNKRQKK